MIAFLVHCCVISPISDCSFVVKLSCSFFSTKQTRAIPYHLGYIKWASRSRNCWPHKKNHVRPDYSTGLVRLADAEQPSTENENRHPSISSLVSPFVANSRASTTTSQWSFDFASLDGDKFTKLLPAARLVQTPLLSRVFCMLQSDTLLSMFAAKEDAKAGSRITLLGMRLLYLVSELGFIALKFQSSG